MASLHEDGFYYDYFAALNEEERQTNALWVANYFREKGWTDNAIAGMLGNMHAESTINPARWESNTDWRAQGINSKGFGLTQWTPWRKYTRWCEDKGFPEWHINSGCYRVHCEFSNLGELEPQDLYGGGQYYTTNEFPMTRSEFMTSTADPGYLAKVFVRNYERPASVLKSDDETEEEHQAAKAETYRRRAAMALTWYEYITGHPYVPVGGASSSSIIKFLTLYKRRRYVVR